MVQACFLQAARRKVWLQMRRLLMLLFVAAVCMSGCFWGERGRGRGEGRYRGDEHRGHEGERHEGDHGHDNGHGGGYDHH